MGTKSFVLKPNQKPSKKQLDMVKLATKRPIVEDDDIPDFTEEQLTLFYRIREKNTEIKEEKRKQNITLRLSPSTIKKAKSLGKGYTTILAGIIEEALNENNYVKPLKS